MKDPVLVRELLAAIGKMPPEKPVHAPGKWHRPYQFVIDCRAIFLCSKTFSNRGLS